MRTDVGLAWQGGQMFGTPGAAMKVIALSSDTVAPASGDTVMAGELTGSGLDAAVGTVTHTGGTNIWTVAHTFTYSGGTPVTVNKVSVRDQTTVSGSKMGYEALEPSPPTLTSGDQLTETVQFTLT